ncbi:MAG TPA: site-2 protease family protein [Thermoanaerobaculia bacterium]|jgi:regulator of sigma E protease|nr:site-2 protease family protein [Thermoanaerobaculia bacterium]
MVYLGVLVLLSLLILIHELGHLAMARWVGIPVSSFSVGFGPKVWSWRRGWTEYSLRTLPLGGYVLPAVADADDFRAIPLRRRLAYFLGGPLANLAAALVLCAGMNVAANGPSWYGILIAPFDQVALASIPIMSNHPDQMSGVIGIVVEGGRIATQGLILSLAFSLSVSLAVLNLLPIPVLDGGQIFMSCLEDLFPSSAKLRVPLTLLGLLLLAALMIYANGQDLMHYWG